MPNNSTQDKELTVSQTSQTTAKTSSTAVNILKGSVIGATEVAIDHPLWVIKTRLQNKENFSFNPRVLYRGIQANMGSMIPITAIQVATTNGLENAFHTKTMKKNSKLFDFQSLFCAFAGGAASATIGTGTELAMAHMTGQRGFTSTVGWFLKYKGIQGLNTGFCGTATRDGLFTIGFMKAPKLVETKLTSLFPEYQKVACAISGPLSGVIAAVLSHPFDSIKTRQQKVAHEKKLSPFHATREIIKNEGFLTLYKGLLPRATRVISAITIMDKVGKELDDYHKKRKP